MPRVSAVLFFLVLCLCLAPAGLRAAGGVQKIAILEFEPVTARAKSSEKGRLVSEMLTTAAVNSGRFEVVERRIISRLLEELEFGERGLTYTSAALKVGAMAGATAIVGGSVAEEDGKARIDARLIDVESGRILWAGVAMGPAGLSGVSGAADRLFADLAAFAEAERRREAAPPTPPAPSVSGPDTAEPGGQDRDAAEDARRAAMHHEAAKKYGRAKRYAQAEKEMDAAIALDPGRAEYHAARGHARYFQGRHAEALDDYDRCLALSDAQPAAHSMRALCLTAQGRGEEALAAYDRAVDLDKGNAELLVRRGKLLSSMGRAADMCRDFEAACGLGQCRFLETARKEGSCPAAP